MKRNFVLTTSAGRRGLPRRLCRHDRRQGFHREVGCVCRRHRWQDFPAPAEKPVMDQKGLMFNPHVMVIQQGTTVEFLNSDSVQHNVFWPSISGNKKLGHNLGTWPKGDKRPFKFDQPGVVPLLCNVHPEMAGYIVVSPTPYFAETDASGNYKIENVPDGKYNVVAWHEGMKTQTKPVDVSGYRQS